MKRMLFTVLLIVFLVLSLNAETPGYWSFHSEIDLAFGLKAGAEYRFTDHFGLRGSFGASLLGPSQMCYTLVGISHLMQPKKTFQLDIQYGLIQAVFDVITPESYAYWFPGACVCTSFRTKNGHRFGIRAGGGVGLGYDQGEWRDDPFFLPNIALEYGYSSRR